MTDDAWNQVRRHLDQAGQALAGLVEGRSMCAIGRSGRSFPAAKYHEGATSAPAQLRHGLKRRAGHGEAPDVSVLARTAAADWRERADRPATAGPHWHAYLAGGAEALEALAEELDSP